MPHGGHKHHTRKKLKRRGSSNFTKRRELAVALSLKRHKQSIKKSKSHAAAFGSRNISDAAARRREIFLQYCKRPKTAKEKKIQKHYAQNFPKLVVGVHIIGKWIRSVSR